MDVTDPFASANFGMIHDILKDIRDDLPARSPVVVSTLEPPENCKQIMANGVEHEVIALAVWSSGAVTPIYRVPGRGHIRTLGVDESWHFTSDTPVDI